jgi:hypothetical protein
MVEGRDVGEQCNTTGDMGITGSRVYAEHVLTHLGRACEVMPWCRRAEECSDTGSKAWVRNTNSQGM